MALTENFKVPALANSVTADLSQMRDNWYFLLLAAARVAEVIPGWTTTIASSSSPVDYSKPDSLTLSRTDTTVSPNVTRQIRYVYTWTGNNLTTIVCQYNDGSTSPQFVTVTGGTITLTYSGANFTGATSA